MSAHASLDQLLQSRLYRLNATQRIRLRSLRGMAWVWGQHREYQALDLPIKMQDTFGGKVYSTNQSLKGDHADIYTNVRRQFT